MGTTPNRALQNACIRRNALLQADELSIDDIRSQRSVSDYVQSVARHARDAGFREEYQHVLWAWNYLAPSLQRDIDEPSEKSTLLSFIMQLESRKTAWGRFYAQKVPENLQRPQGQQNWAPSRQNNGQPSYNPQGIQPEQQQQQAFRNGRTSSTVPLAAISAPH